MSNYNSEFAVGSFSSAPIDVKAQSTTGTQNPADWFVDLLGGSISDSGLRVDGYTALTSGPVWQAVSVISGSVATMPVDVFQSVGDKKRKRPDLPAYQLLKVRPHPEFLPSAFKEILTAWACLYGNGLARIDRANANIPLSMTPLVPNSTYLDRDENGKLWYMHTPEGGGQVQPMEPDDVFHIIGPHGGLWGASLIDYAKNTIGQSLALEKHGNSVFKNAARPSGVLEVDAQMTAENRRNLRREWKDVHAGSDKAGEIGLLVGGVKFKPMSMSNEDAQWISAIDTSRINIASWFNLPPHVLNSMENSSVRANLEEQNKSLWNMGLKPWFVKWQEEAEFKLFTPAQQRKNVFSVRFDPKGLLAADFETRYKGYSIARQWGWMSANDVLRLEDEDDIGDQGDVYMVPVNMANAETGESFGGGESESEPEPPPQPVEENNLANIKPGLVAELQKIIRLEGNKVKQAARKASKNEEYRFCQFVDEFYDEKFNTIWCDELQPVSSIVAQISGTVLDVAEVGTTYTEMSREFWLDLASTSTPDTLLCDVTERLTRWQDRAHMAADMILEASYV